MTRLNFSLLALPHLDTLFRVARRLGARGAEAEDLVQETFLDAQRSFAQLKDPACCRAWLLCILRRQWFARRRKAARVVDVLGIVEPAGNLEDELLAGGFSDEVERALRALAEELRTALLLVAIEGLSYDEVAQAMECPIGTVRSRVARARAQMGDELHAAQAPRIRGRQ